MEVTLSLTPKEASSGVIRSVDLPSGPVMVRVPPLPGGGLVRILTAHGEVRIRVTVSAGPGRRTPMLLGLAVLVAVVGGLVVLNDHDGRSSSAGAPAASATPFRPDGTGAPTPSVPPAPAAGVPAIPSVPSLAPPPSPHDSGTCLDGEAPPRSATAVSVDPFHVVGCSSSRAHYRVIRTFHGTEDLDMCKGVEDTQYSYSSSSSRGGRTLWRVVYCLVGLGSYAR
ncbi:hypothetical protein AF335_07560 [Streptomyces eurocidicus]|uniref:Uncharacterized protein n=1 Tax=Streptomyces eurocidicus TaxID=66423 RepID=A0A2N8P0A1_STREU|nr:hypothetical protein AF335_07560 [Streptomyces eurocidicus]